MTGCSLVSKHQHSKGTCCFHLEGHSVLGEWRNELHRLQRRQSDGNKEGGWGARIWLEPIQTSYFWLVSFITTCLCHHSASSLYSLWPWRWTQHVPLKWWYEPTRLHGVNKDDCPLKTLRTYIITFRTEETNPYWVIEGGESEDVPSNANHCKAPIIYTTKTVVRVNTLWEPVMYK